MAKKLFTNATVTPNKMYNDFIKADFDALVCSFYEARAFTLAHPEFTVVKPTPPLGREYLAYAMDRSDVKFITFINEWLDLQIANGFLDEQFHYFMLGNVESPEQKRWSIGRDVFNLWG